MGKFNLSRESIYKRLRGDVPFTFEQVKKLSLELNFSLDNIDLQFDNAPSILYMQSDNKIRPEDAFLGVLQNYYNTMTRQARSRDIGSFITLNRLLILNLIHSDTLFHFHYYSHMCQANDLPFNYKFSDCILPEEIRSLQKNINDTYGQVSNFTFFVDSFVFSKTLLEIRYYFERKLISNKEYSLLKSELNEEINMFEILTRKGEYIIPGKFFYYRSILPIPFNSVYSWYDDNAELSIYNYSMNPFISTNNKNINAFHLQWIDSLKKRSVLMTQSNEQLQESFFNDLRAQLRSIL